MNDVTESEAQSLLSVVSYCDGCATWEKGDQAGEQLIEVGLTDTQGNKTGLVLKLYFRMGPATKVKTYIFSVFSTALHQLDRVYQLAIDQSPRPPKDLHQLPHEHFGRLKTIGTPEWRQWSYAQVLSYFSSRTNIIFRPSPPDPGQTQRRKK